LVNRASDSQFFPLLGALSDSPFRLKVSPPSLLFLPLLSPQLFGFAPLSVLCLDGPLSPLHVSSFRIFPSRLLIGCGGLIFPLCVLRGRQSGPCPRGPPSCFGIFLFPSFARPPHCLAESAFLLVYLSWAAMVFSFTSSYSFNWPFRLAYRQPSVQSRVLPFFHSCRAVSFPSLSYDRFFEGRNSRCGSDLPPSRNCFFKGILLRFPSRFGFFFSAFYERCLLGVLSQGIRLNSQGTNFFPPSLFKVT